MANYHVGCGLAGIYAGTLKKSGVEWLHKSDVTKEAISAVMEHMYFKVPDDKHSYAYAIKTRDGKYLRLTLAASAACPDWAKDALEGGGEKHE